MTWASRQRGAAGAPSRSHAKTVDVVGVDAELARRGRRPRRPGVLGRGVEAGPGQVETDAAPVGGPNVFASSRVSTRRVCALPSKPPHGCATSSSACSPLCPNGGCPRSWARQAVSTRSGSQPSGRPSSRPICATSREWVSRVRRKSDSVAAHAPASCRPAAAAPRRAAPWPGRARTRCARAAWAARGPSAGVRGRRTDPGRRSRRRTYPPEWASSAPAGTSSDSRVVEPAVRQTTRRAPRSYARAGAQHDVGERPGRRSSSPSSSSSSAREDTMPEPRCAARSRRGSP